MLEDWQTERISVNTEANIGCYLHNERSLPNQPQSGYSWKIHQQLR